MSLLLEPNCYFIEGDLLDFPRDIEVIMHQANTENCMRSGIAAQIVKRFPQMQMADELFYRRNAGTNRLGQISYADGVFDGKLRRGINLYGQTLTPIKGVYTQYRYLSEALYKANHMCRIWQRDKPLRVGIPYLMGCDIARGSWDKVERLVADAFAQSLRHHTMELYVVSLPKKNQK